MTTEEQSLPEPEETFSVGTDLEISALASDQIVHALPTVSIRDAATIMDAEGIGLLVLKSEDGIAGVVSERDILKAVAAGADLEGSAVSAVTGDTVQRASPSSTVHEVATEMMENYIRHVLIADSDGELVGVVSVRDLLAVIVN